MGCPVFSFYIAAYQDSLRVPHQRRNPRLRYAEAVDRPAKADPRYPIVCTTYRLAEHWQTVTRALPWNLELQPQVFVEMSHELGELRKINSGDRVVVESTRGRLTGTAVVTHRLTPLTIADQMVHLIGIPWHYGQCFQT